MAEVDFSLTSFLCNFYQFFQKVYQLIKKRRSESRDQIDIDRSMNIDRVVLIDRAVDLVTPLVSQLTYEGLIDEIFGIKCSKKKVWFFLEFFEVWSFFSPM